MLDIKAVDEVKIGDQVYFIKDLFELKTSPSDFFMPVWFANVHKIDLASYS